MAKEASLDLSQKREDLFVGTSVPKFHSLMLYFTHSQDVNFPAYIQET
jgi:hypothetical protein